jgi:hypothetical protein
MAKSSAVKTVRVLFILMLCWLAAVVSSFATPGRIYTSVQRDPYQYCSFTLWYHIPAVSGSLVVKVWERDWEGFERDVNTMVLSHTNDWAMRGMGIEMHGLAVTADVEITCYKDTAYVDDAVLIWSYNKLPNPGFERWSDGEPEGWGTSRYADPQSIFRSRDAHSGRYCVALVNTVVGVEDDLGRVGGGPEFQLLQNSPNPVHNSTTISYSLPTATQVTLSIYDITGRLVETLANDTQQPGIHQVRWDRKANPSGVYFYRLKAGEFVETRKIVVVVD